MNRYVLSEAADADIEGIARHSITQWGLVRAERYILELHRAFETLGEFPHLGRDSDCPGAASETTATKLSVGMGR